MNTLAGQIDLLNQEHKKLADQVSSARQKVNESRESYIQHILDLRKLADEVRQVYKAKPGNPTVRRALARLNEQSDGETTYALESPRSFKASLRRLESLEDKVLSESIPIRRTEGDALFVSTMLNGEHAQEMVLDSGASLVTLPHKVAVDCGLEPKDTDPGIVLQLADGRPIAAKLVTLSSLRVGTFTVEDVECAVLGPEAVNAEPLLGMSFLGHFTFEVDADAGQLKLVRVKSGGQ